MVIEGTRVWPAPEDVGRFLYVPGPPRPERSPDGTPAVTVIVAGEGGTLQLGVHWGLDAEQSDRLRARLAEENPELDRQTIVLSPAEITVSRVVLEIADGKGGFRALGESAGSGFPPFSAVFGVAISGEDRARAMAALEGSAGYLRVRYLASGTVRLWASAVVAGDVREELAVLDRLATIAQARELIEESLAEGRLHVVIEGEAPDELRSAARDAAIEDAAATLVRIARGDEGGDEARLEATASVADDLPVQFDPTSDVGSWFAGAAGAEGHVFVAPGSGAQGEAPTGIEEVRL